MTAPMISHKSPAILGITPKNVGFGLTWGIGEDPIGCRVNDVLN